MNTQTEKAFIWHDQINKLFETNTNVGMKQPTESAFKKIWELTNVNLVEEYLNSQVVGDSYWKL